MKIHVSILAAIHLFLGYCLLLFVIAAHIFFLKEWSTSGISFFTEPLSFVRFHNEFFAERGYFVGWTLFVAAITIALGHGLLRRRNWAWWLGSAAIVMNTVLFGCEVVNGNMELATIIQLGLTGYLFWVLSDLKVRQEFRITNQFD